MQGTMIRVVPKSEIPRSYPGESHNQHFINLKNLTLMAKNKITIQLAMRRINSNKHKNYGKNYGKYYRNYFQ